MGISMMTYKQFSKLLERDGGRCYHCGATGDNLVPQHRLNRGMGGSKERERLSNIITLCSIVNGLLESDADVARLGREKGWKLSVYEDPLKVPVYETWSGKSWLLKDDGTRVLAPSLKG